MNIRDSLALLRLKTPLANPDWAVRTHMHWPILEQALHRSPYGRTLALQLLSDLDNRRVTRRTTTRLLRLKTLCQDSGSDADLALYCFLCAYLHDDSGQHGLTETALRAANQFGHRYHMIHMMLGARLLERGLFAEADRELDLAIDCIYQFPPLDEAKRQLIGVLQSLRAQALLMMHRPEEAETLLEKAAHAADAPYRLNSLALLHAYHGRAEEAGRALEALRAAQSPMVEVAARHVPLLLEGRHSHFTVIPADPEAPQRYWNFFLQEEDALRSRLKVNGPADCLAYQRAIFNSICPVDSAVDEVSVRFGMTDGKPCIRLSAQHSRTGEAFLRALIAACPPGLSERWTIDLRPGDPEAPAISLHDVDVPVRRLPLQLRLSNALAAVALRRPFAPKPFAAYWSVYRAILAPAFQDMPCGRLAALRIRHDWHLHRAPAASITRLRQLQALADSGPDADRALYYFLGAAVADMRQDAEDIPRWLRPSLRAGASFHLIHSMLGEHYLHGRHAFSRAEAEYRQALSLIRVERQDDLRQKLAARYQSALAITLMMRHRTQKAGALLKEAASQPDCPDHQHALALLHALHGRREEAHHALSRLRELDAARADSLEPGLQMLLEGTHPHFTAKTPDEQLIAKYWAWFAANEAEMRRLLNTKDGRRACREHQQAQFAPLVPEPAEIDVMFTSFWLREGRPAITFNANHSRTYAALIAALIRLCPKELTDGPDGWVLIDESGPIPPVSE